MYRDDLEAALARNHDLQRRVNELETATRTTQRVGSEPTAMPRPLTPPARVTKISYVAPATYVPHARLFMRYASSAWRGLRATVPTLNVPKPAPSSILVLELLRRLVVGPWIALCLVLQGLWCLVGALWFLTTVAIVGCMTGLVTPLMMLVVVLASVRYQRAGVSRTVGLQWGVSPDDSSALLYASLMALWSFYLVGAILWLVT